MIIGIDASNLRAGGGITHLTELLRAANPAAHGFEKIVVWSGAKTLAKIDERKWLVKMQDSSLDKALPYRLFWQRFQLKKQALQMGCNVLFVPGGSDSSGFKPVITMSRNMLPFEWNELLRYGLSPITFKLILLRFAQSRTFRKANGLIFLTYYAQLNVIKCTGPLPGKITTVPHGISPRFFIQPRPQREASTFTARAPCRILYVSIVDPYKHQLEVVRAISELAAGGLHVHLDLVGPIGRALKTVLAEIENKNLANTIVTYHGGVAYDKLHEFYERADIGIFASSCENMPNILLEGMAAGLPMACSNMGPMPEILAGAGVYFNPLDPSSIGQAVKKIYASAALRTELADKAFKQAKAFSWQRCAAETFAFIATFDHVAS
jgi:glycosyltransferase involved in cell wall biosynthesis